MDCPSDPDEILILPEVKVETPSVHLATQQIVDFSNFEEVQIKEEFIIDDQQHQTDLLHLPKQKKDVNLDITEVKTDLQKNQEYSSLTTNLSGAMSVSMDSVLPLFDSFMTNLPVLPPLPIPLAAKRKRTKSSGHTPKKKKDKTAWIDFQAKQARITGTQGLGRNDSDIRPRQLGPGCDPLKCKKECHKNFNPAERQFAFGSYWSAGDQTAKWQLINSLVHPMPVKSSQKTHKTSSIIHYQYSLPKSSGALIIVCKKMFLETLDISYSVIETAKTKQRAAGADGQIQPDMRGCYPKKIDEAKHEPAREHIGFFPVIESHLDRRFIGENHEAYSYLEVGITCSRMYRLYRSWLEIKNIKDFVSQQSYERILKKEFNYKYFHTRNDSCKKCDLYTYLLENGQVISASVEWDQEQHLENLEMVKMFRKEAEQMAKNHSDICAIKFSMHKELSTPRSKDSNPMVYMTKLSVYHLMLHDLETDSRTSYLWNETVGNKFLNEIPSILWRFIEERSAQGVTEFFFFGDNFGNDVLAKILISMFVKAAALFGLNITYTLFEIGHSEGEDDIMYNFIKNQTKNRDIWNQEQWGALLSEVYMKNKYKVVHMQQDEILDFSKIPESLIWDELRVLEVKELTVTCTELHNVVVKYDRDNSEKKIRIMNYTATDSIKEFNFEKAYSQKLRLSSSKFKSLENIIADNYIPDGYKSFINDIVKEQKDIYYKN